MATKNSPVYNTDVSPNKLTLNGTFPVAMNNETVTRRVSFLAKSITSASGTSAIGKDGSIGATDLVRIMKVPVGAVITELALQLSDDSIPSASTAMTVGLGANSGALVTTLITANKSEVTKATVIRHTDRLTTVSPTIGATVGASSSSNSADVVSFLLSGAAASLSSSSSGTITVAATYYNP